MKCGRLQKWFDDKEMTVEAGYRGSIWSVDKQLGHNGMFLETDARDRIMKSELSLECKQVLLAGDPLERRASFSTTRIKRWPIGARGSDFKLIHAKTQNDVYSQTIMLRCPPISNR
jgi:hypothetical protein